MIEIIKADGTREAFDHAKLDASLRRAGARPEVAQKVCEQVQKTLSSGVSTHEIYRRAFKLLREEEHGVAVRYSLRRAVFELGPTGHPFEDFIAELFRKEGWKVEWRKMVPGKCISHEVDVYATKDNEALAAELKYHNDPNYKTDVKTALYVKARFDDIWQCDPAVRATCPVDRGFLITNTKFTESAIQYSHCAGIELLGWSYPTEGNLYDRLVTANIFPITALTTLKKAEKRLLLDRGVVTTEMLLRAPDMFKEVGVGEGRRKRVEEEIEVIKRHGVE